MQKVTAKNWIKLLTLFLFGLDEAFFQYVLTLLLVLANVLGILLPRISLSREIWALCSFIYSPFLPFTSFTHKKKPFLFLKMIGMIWWLLCVGERKIIFFLPDAFFLFPRISSWPFINRDCFLAVSINKVLALNSDTCGYLVVGASIVLHAQQGGECGVCVRDENEQVTTVQWLLAVFRNILMGIDKMQFIWRVRSRSFRMIWSRRILRRSKYDRSRVQP